MGMCVEVILAIDGQVYTMLIVLILVEEMEECKDLFCLWHLLPGGDLELFII